MIDVLVNAFTDPKLWLIVLIWGALAMLERWFVFRGGRRAGDAILEEMPGLTPDRQDQVSNLFERFGSGILLFASIPLFGQVLTALAGADKSSSMAFLVLVSISYFVRNWLVVILSEQIVNAFL